MDILKFLRQKLVPDRTPVTPAEVKKVSTSKEDAEMFKCYGITNEALRQVISDQNLIIYERASIYQVVDRSLNHSLMSAACVAFADTACQRSPLHGSSVWVTSDNREYRYQIEKMLDVINVEETIYDWAWTTAAFGDLFVEVFGEPGVGIVCVNDDNHPINVSRVDHNGRLVGFFQTPLGYATTDTRKLLAPWDHVHFRLLGAKKRRPIYQDQQYCISGNTRIHLLDRTVPTVKEMSENKDKYIGKALWSINPETKGLEVDTIVDVQKTRLNAQLVRVHLDNEQHIDCTPDHRFMLRDGTYKEAKDLVQGESLMPLYTKLVPNGQNMAGYKLVYNPKDEKYHFEHRLVGGKIKRGYVIHHKDFNPINNEPSNLEVMTVNAHAKLHKLLAKYLIELYKDPVLKAKFHKLQKEGRQKAYADPEFRQYCSDLISKASIDHWQDPDYRKRVVAGIRAAMATPEYRAKRSEIAKEIRNREDVKEKYEQTYNDPEWKQDWSAKQKELYKNPDHKAMVLHSHKEGCGCFRCKAWRKSGQLVLNHKVVSVEWLTEHEDTYDIQTKKNHNFPTVAGVFIHNSEFRTISIMTPDARRLTSKYGTSILADALPVWKRLRLAEDSIMMARIMKSPQRFLFKVVIPEDNANAEAVAHLVDQYQTEIKRARALNLDQSNPNYLDRFNAMASAEDLIFPVWGNENNLTVETLGGECLRGDVKIHMLDGTTPTIKEMTDNKEKYIGKDIYACNKEGEVVGRRIKNVLMTRPNTDFVRVHIDNGEHFDVTPDHPCMLRNGEFKHAELLQPGESLMPLYTKLSENKKTLGYEETYIPKTGKYKLTHRIVAGELLKEEHDRKYKELVETGIEKYLVIHHKDLNKYNNDVSNLQWMGEQEHFRLHAMLIEQLNLKREGKTYEEIYGEEHAAKMISDKSEWLTNKNNERWSKLSPEERSRWFNEKIRPVRKEIVHKPDCSCDWCMAGRGELNAFSEVKDVVCKHCGKDLGNIKQSVYANHVRWDCSKRAVETSVYQNHKVVRVERLDIIEDAYDLVIEGAYDKHGGPEHCFALACGVFVHNTDIRWIADIDKLEDQLITALKVPKQLLAGFSGEGGGGFEGGTALERMDIRFARQARRVQRSLLAGLTRMAQIHLAYQGMDPDLNLFSINMAETSSAEEIELQDALGKSVEATRGLYDMLTEIVGVDLDKKKLLKYFNEKFFKLSDLDIDELYLKGDASAIKGDLRDLPVAGAETPEEGAEEAPVEPNVFRESLLISDLKSPLPNHKTGKLWEQTWKDAPVKIEPISEVNK